MPPQRDLVAAAAGNPPVIVRLEHARGRHARWLLIGGVLGGLSVANLGTLGQGVGIILLGLAAWAGYKLAKTFLNSAGDIVIDGDLVRLPHGLCHGAASKLPRSAVTTAYFLRRSVPFNHAAPVLVVEADGQAFIYPRDWFASEADQRRVLEALLGAPTAASADGSV